MVTSGPGFVRSASGNINEIEPLGQHAPEVASEPVAEPRACI